MMQKRLFLLFFLLFSAFSCRLLAQDMIVLGRVVDKKDNQPIPVANVWIKNASYGTETNAEGYFFMRIPYKEKYTLVVSCIGYKRKEVDLKNELDQFVEVKMQEESLLLDELVVLPGKNPAFYLMKRVRENKPLNNPNLLFNRQNEVVENTDFYLFNIKKKWMQRKYLRDVAGGTVEQQDSSLVLPLYHLDVKKQLTTDADGHCSEQENERNENALQALGNEPFRALLENYISEVDFYKNNIILFGRNFISPLANFGNVYYQYYLLDSINNNDRKQYLVRFRPKNTKDLAFKGEMLIDSLTAALVDMKAQLPSSANINLVNDVVLNHSYLPYKNTFVPQTEQDLLTFQLRLKKDTKKGFAAMYQHNAVHGNYGDIDSIKADADTSVSLAFPDSVREQMQLVSAKIDTLNNSKIQRLAASAVDLFLHGYVHAWKFDIGPLINIYRYNKLEGHRLSFGVRTGESMMKNFTIGGFFGYGFGDKQWKYGGEFQARFGRDNRHRIGLFFSDNVEEYGSQTYTQYLNENWVGDVYNIFSSVRLKYYGDFARRRRYEVDYRYEEKRFAVFSQVKYETLFSNPYVPFTQQKMPLPSVNVGSVSVGARLAFKQRYIDGFFHRYYLYNNLPVVYMQMEYGHYSLAGEQVQHGDYMKFVAFMRHSFPLLGGKFKYRVEVGHVAGQVPWTLLDITRVGAGLWVSDSRFCFIQPMEFVSDTYAYAGFTYFTKGFLFNWIPGVKKLNLREVVSVNCAMGGILNPHHTDVLDFPTRYSTDNLNIPYVEVSVGIANILQVMSVESVWRATHRNNDNAVKWGIRLRFNVDF